MSQSVSEIGGSLGDYMSAVRSAFDRQFPTKRTNEGSLVSGYWVRDIFEDYIIVNDEIGGGGLWRVDYRKPATTTPTGPAFVFDTRDKWQRVKLTYAKEMVGDTIVTEFAGAIPDVAPRPGVDLAELTAGDPDPFYLTVEISTIGRTSKNGLIHDATLASTLLTQINSRASEGIMGHIKETERSTAYPTSDIHWLGAAQLGKSVFARGYVPKTAVAQREHFRILKATKGRAATSITGPAVREFVDKKAGTWKATGFQLEQLDLAPHTRAALPPESDFLITREMGDHYQVIEEYNMTKEELLAQITAGEIPANVREQIVREASGQTQQVSELTTKLTGQATTIAELEAKLNKYQIQEFDRDLDTRIAALMPWTVKGDAAKKAVDTFQRTLKARIVAEIGENRTADHVSEVVATVWTDLQPLAETVRDALAGPAAVVNGKVRSGEAWRDELANNAGQLRREKGI